MDMEWNTYFLIKYHKTISKHFSAQSDQGVGIIIIRQLKNLKLHIKNY